MSCRICLPEIPSLATRISRAPSLRAEAQRLLQPAEHRYSVDLHANALTVLVNESDNPILPPCVLNNRLQERFAAAVGPDNERRNAVARKRAPIPFAKSADDRTRTTQNHQGRAS